MVVCLVVTFGLHLGFILFFIRVVYKFRFVGCSCEVLEC